MAARRRGRQDCAVDWTAPDVARTDEPFTAGERATLLRERIDGTTGA
jgi:hypothetical protein